MQGIQLSVNKIGAMGNVVLVRIKGFIDTTTSAELHGALQKLLADGFIHFVVDMGGVNYVSSAGWGVFVGEIKGIREKGGDLKIVQMTPDVYEVFAMLEFNRILDFYESIEESINDFDISMGLDISRSAERKPVQINKDEIISTTPPLKGIQRTSEKGTERKFKKWSTVTRQKVDEANIPVIEKIKIIIIENPSNGLLKIRKELNAPRFGYQKIGLWQLRSLLKKYNLETKEKRYRFYRSR